MIDINEVLNLLDEEEDRDVKNNEEYQHKLFREYVLRNQNNAELRKELSELYDSGAELMGKDGLRKRLAAIDMGYFGRAYLSHYFSRKSPEFHEELDTIWREGVLKNINPLLHPKDVNKEAGSHRVIAAPRGHAKSTNFTFKDDLHAICYGYKHYIMILSDSSEQAEAFLEDIKSELEENANIIMDFGRLKGNKAWRSGVIVTSNNVKVEAIGSGKKIRGRKHKNWRPDLIVLDDIENDENVDTPEQRRKLKNWFNKAVSKAGDTYTDIMYIGTILHYDSLLNNTLQNPRYKAKKYQAIIQEASNQKLWDEWEAIFTNLFNEDHEEDAKTFFEANEEEMLKGSKVLWESKLSYYDLMVIRISEGEASFNSELQNEPIDPDNATFNEEWYDFYEMSDVDFRKPRFIFIGSNDPSLGKNKKSDTSSIFALALDMQTGYIYVETASIERRKPDVIMDDIFEIHKRLLRDYGKGFYQFGVETVQFQYYFKEVMTNKSRELGLYIPFVEINSNSNKMLRIESLQPMIKNRYIKLRRDQKVLLKQMSEFPMGKNDDGPDGLQMGVQLAQNVRATAPVTNYKSVCKRGLRFRKGAY